MDGNPLRSHNGVSFVLTGGVYIGNSGRGEVYDIETPSRGLPFIREPYVYIHYVGLWMSSCHAIDCEGV